MLFNLTNMSVIFQVYINKTLSDLLDVCCIIYLDDILIYFNFKKQHCYHIHKVLECLHKYRLYVKISKCSFEIDTVCNKALACYVEEIIRESLTSQHDE